MLVIFTHLWANLKREPVRWFTGLSQLVPLIVTGLLVFDAWNPNAEQLAYVTGLPAALALVFGVTIVRNAVTPNDKLPAAVVDRARDAGLSTIETIALFVVLMFAFYGLVAIFNWDLP